MPDESQTQFVTNLHIDNALERELLNLMLEKDPYDHSILKELEAE